MTTFLRRPFLNHPIGIASDSHTARVLPRGGQLTKDKALHPLTRALSCLQIRLTNFTHPLPKCVTMCLLTILSLGSLVLTTACTAIPAAGRSIYESPDTIVRLEPGSKVSPSGGSDYSHPVLLTKDQIDILLTSISAQAKVGLLRTLISDPGAPRLFDRTDIGLLVNPIQEALAKATPGEAVVFYRAKTRRGARALVASGFLFVHDDVLTLHISNLWHPVITTAADVGSKARLEDIRETTDYVLNHAWVSVGEQDFAVFFDDPKYQINRPENSLWAHPERTITIAYLPYVRANPDPVRRAKESEDAVQQAATPRIENQAIADLKRRLVELEQKNAVLEKEIHNSPGISGHPDPQTAPQPQPQAERVSTERLFEIIHRLENRILEMERELDKNRK